MDIQLDIHGELVTPDELAIRLKNPLQARAIKQMILKIEQEQRAATCPQHDEVAVIAIIVRGEKIGARVSACCQPFVDQLQTMLKPLLAEAAALSSGFGLVRSLENNLSGKILQIVLPKHNNQALEFDINRIDRLTIGRLDTDTGRQPDIDLAAFAGQENGVSRLHATLLRDKNSLFLIDEGSANGTWINDQRLQPQQRYDIRHGDNLYFGQLNLRIVLDNPSLVNSGS